MYMLAPSPDLLSALTTAKSVPETISALTKLKISMIGHDQRKQSLVKAGILPILSANIFKVFTPSSSTSSDWSKSSRKHAATWGSNDDVLLEATIIVASLARSGPAFVAPLQASKIIPDIMIGLLAVRPLPKLAREVLIVLRDFSVAWHEQREASGRGDARDSDAPSSNGIFEGDAPGIFNAILNTAPGKEEMLKPVCLIIGNAAVTTFDKNALLEAGVLETLTSLFAEYTAPHVFDSTHTSAVSHWSEEVPITIRGRYENSLSRAIIAIIEGSTFRAHRFCFSEALRKLLPPYTLSYERASQAYWGPKHGFYNMKAPLLPPIQTSSQKNVNFNGGSNAFPALGLLRNKTNVGNASSPPTQASDGNAKDAQTVEVQATDADHMNAVIGWLLFLARSCWGIKRLRLLRLIAVLNNTLNADPLGTGVQRSGVQQLERDREKQVALLAVPLLTEIIQRYGCSSKNPSLPIAANEANMSAKEDCCLVLGLLIARSKILQTAAVDAGAVKHVCACLKRTFDNVAIANPMWGSRIGQDVQIPDNVDPATCTLGSKGLQPEFLSAMRCRRGALEALAALAKQEDVHRKAIVDEGVVSCIIDSLKPSPPVMSPQQQPSIKETNTSVVIISACHAAQSLSRSVSLLRTSLIDAGISKPILSLLSHHPDTEVRIAATDVCCNIILDFSPMRDDLMADGVVSTLASHVRNSSENSDPKLKLSSLWALKHLVLSASREVKVQVVEEIGVEWLLNITSGRSDGVKGGGGVLTSRDASGGRVDLLNPTGGASADAEAGMDVDDNILSSHQQGQTRLGSEEDDEDDDEEGEDDDEEEEDDDGELLYDSQSQTHYHSSQMRSTLQSHHNSKDNTKPPTGGSSSPAGVLHNLEKYLTNLHVLENSPLLLSRAYSIQLREQSLDLIRNLFNGEDCPYMVDFLLTRTGYQQFFDILTSLLSPIKFSGGEKRPVYHPIVLILSTLHILTHLANAGVAMRKRMVEQRDLWKAWLPHFSNPVAKVRVLCVWAVNSLTWIESESSGADGHAQDGRRDTRSIVEELRRFGVETKVRSMLGDSDLDVRERCKTAVRQMECV